MNRRQFLKNTGALASLPLFVNGLQVVAHPMPLLFGNLDEDSDRILVIIRLNGGNDGLNTIIPIDQYPTLYKMRYPLLIPEQQTLKLTDKTSIHPAMSGLKSMYDDGKVKVVQSVGYPNQNRSHFRSMEIWSTADPDNQFANVIGSTGWLGRYFDGRFPDFPENYPNSQEPDPFTISMSHYVSETCQGLIANYSIALPDPDALIKSPDVENKSQYDPFYREELDYVNLIIDQTNGYADSIEKAMNLGTNRETYPETELGGQMKNMARLISGGLRTRVYIADLGGFDTHGHQVEDRAPASGRHAELLKTLSDAIKTFMDDLRQMGLEDRVLVMTFSEFGRQIYSNDALGTDHGSAAPLILAGACLNPQMLGHNPIIPFGIDPQDGVPMQYDFRDVYGSVLTQWFGLPAEDVSRLLYAGFQELPLIDNDCRATTRVRSSAPAPIEMSNYPNPFREQTYIRFQSGNDPVRLSILDALGNELQVLTNKRLGPGNHEIGFDARHLPAGNYFYRLMMGEGRQATRQMIKIQ